MEPAVRGARPQSGITSPPTSRITLAQNRNCGCKCGRNSARARPPGTEFLDAETGRQKSPLKRATVCRDQSSGIGWPKVPVETHRSASYRKYTVCKGWMVVCAVICEPVSSEHSPENWEFFAKFSK